MKNEDRKLLLKNCAFIAVFAILFICYCWVTSQLTVDNHTSKSASADVEEKKVIVVDPGHGGEDCGAIGAGGILE